MLVPDILIAIGNILIGYSTINLIYIGFKKKKTIPNIQAVIFYPIAVAICIFILYLKISLFFYNCYNNSNFIDNSINTKINL